MPTLTPTHAAMASPVGWIAAPEAGGPACFCCDEPATEFKPLLEGSEKLKRLWLCRPCETTWVD
jgi:hypothetical protein